MKPKKKVLIYCTDEVRLAELGFLVGLWGCSVTRAGTMEETLSLAKCRYDCTLVDTNGDVDHAALVRELKRINPEMSVLLLQSRREILRTLADRVVMRDVDTSDLREALRVVLVRKRGPKKARMAQPVAA